MSGKRWAALVMAAATMLLGAAVLAAGLSGETMGGLKLGDLEKTLLDKYGQPETQMPLGDDPAGETVCWEYGYESKGMVALMCGDRKTKQYIISGLIAGGDTKVRTGRGIGAGSAKAEVVKAYGPLQFDGEVGYLTDPACGCGVSFTFVNGKVTELMLRKVN